MTPDRLSDTGVLAPGAVSDPDGSGISPARRVCLIDGRGRNPDFHVVPLTTVRIAQRRPKPPLACCRSGSGAWVVWSGAVQTNSTNSVTLRSQRPQLEQSAEIATAAARLGAPAGRAGWRHGFARSRWAIPSDPPISLVRGHPGDEGDDLALPRRHAGEATGSQGSEVVAHQGLVWPRSSRPVRTATVRTDRLTIRALPH